MPDWHALSHAGNQTRRPHLGAQLGGRHSQRIHHARCLLLCRRFAAPSGQEPVAHWQQRGLQLAGRCRQLLHQPRCARQLLGSLACGCRHRHVAGSSRGQLGCPALRAAQLLSPGAAAGQQWQQLAQSRGQLLRGAHQRQRDGCKAGGRVGACRCGRLCHGCGLPAPQLQLLKLRARRCHATLSCRIAAVQPLHALQQRAVPLPALQLLCAVPLAGLLLLRRRLLMLLGCRWRRLVGVGGARCLELKYRLADLQQISDVAGSHLQPALLALQRLLHVGGSKGRRCGHRGCQLLVRPRQALLPLRQRRLQARQRTHARLQAL